MREARESCFEWFSRESLVLETEIDRAAFGAVAEDLTTAVTVDMLRSLNVARPIIVPGKHRLGGVLYIMLSRTIPVTGRNRPLHVRAIMLSLTATDRVDLHMRGRRSDRDHMGIDGVAAAELRRTISFGGRGLLSPRVHVV